MFSFEMAYYKKKMIIWVWVRQKKSAITITIESILLVSKVIKYESNLFLNLYRLTSI